VTIATLGDVLYRDPSKFVTTEREWARLARAAGREDAPALLSLYERAHRPVFTLAMRITCNRRAAEDVTLEVFDEVRRRGAADLDPRSSVLAWIMNVTRARALERVRAKQRKKRSDAAEPAGLLNIEGPDYADLMAAKEQRRALNLALAELVPGQREAIEAAFFSRLPADAARVRAGLHNLGRALAVSADGDWPEYPNRCDEAERMCVHALQALPPDEARRMEAHLLSCWDCRRELGVVRPVLDVLAAWPTDVLRPTTPLQHVLRISAAKRGGTDLHESRVEIEPEWENVAPGIWCQLLARDAERHVVSMLVRLVPGGEYPPHTHAGVEELHLLDGELWIDERKLQPGDYNRAEPGTGDQRVWSETGCTCVLVTSTRDELGGGS
jgi:RNA polymerase sigma-70 factor (ECF subfamily)